MSAVIVQFFDFAPVAPRPVEIYEDPCIIVVLPMVRTERGSIRGRRCSDIVDDGLPSDSQS